jgi:hypothetical protein
VQRIKNDLEKEIPREEKNAETIKKNTSSMLYFKDWKNWLKQGKMKWV